MDWKDLAGKLIKTGAPIIGGALGGPLGATIGGVAGNILADTLGVEATPEAVERAIDADPAGAAVKLAEADGKWQALAEIAKADAADRTAQSANINETMREEIPKVPWWHWRHLLGYVLVAFGVEAVTLLPLVVMGKITAADMGTLIGALTPLTTVFAALNGYIAQDTTKLKTVALTGEHAPSMTDNVASAIKKVTGKAAPKVIGKPVGSRD
jgi:hypothetical protein